MILEHLSDRLIYLSSSQSRFAWYYIAVSYLIAALYYRYKQGNFRQFTIDAIGKKNWWLPSTAVDIFFFALFSLEIIEFYTKWGSRDVLKYVREFFAAFTIEPLFPQFADELLVKVVWVIFSLLILDFTSYVAHWCSHRSEILWKFHEVHHSAEHLNIFTAARLHPVETFWIAIVVGSISGCLIALTVALFGKAALPWIGYFLPVYFLLRSAVANLRHSHVWICFPNWLSHIVVSPAMHQIHHSLDPKHHGKNLALNFALFDWLFGTLYIPEYDEVKNIKYGLGDESRIRPNSLVSCLLQPFAGVVDLLRRPKAKGSAKESS